MKKIYFVLIAILGTFISNGQVIITELADPDNNAGARFVELYNIGGTGDVDLTDWKLRRWTNGNTDLQGATIDLTDIGSLAADAYVIIAVDGIEFEAVYGFAPDISASAGGPADSNGDDQIALFDASDNIIDIFGVPGEDGTGTCHEFEDGRAERKASVTMANATWDQAEWNTWADSGPDEGVTCPNQTVAPQNSPTDFDPGTWIGDPTACGVTLSTATFTCSSNTIGDNNDGVIINIAYIGSDASISSVTSSTGTVGGDNPASTADGTITISGLSEGDDWDIVLNGGDCDGTIVSGTVDSTQCDPEPNTCFDLSTGTELFEIVTVASNVDMATWEENSGTYSINGFCGGTCTDATNSWLIFGPLDMTGVSDLELLFDANEGFDGTTLDIQYTSDYSSLCPDGATWTSAQVISDAGSYSIDLSAASGTDVFVGIQYLEPDGTTSSSWDISNVSLASFGTCPTLGARPTSDCGNCNVTLQTENYVCASNTDGDNNDQVTVNIPYSGSDNTISSVTTTSAGTVGGDDPALTADGTITITGLGEGDAWDITLNGGDCDGTTVSGTVASAQCDPVSLVINEINADPDATNGDANGDGTIETSQDEFVEIYNTSAVSIDLSDYTIADANSVRHTFPTGTILPANSFITVFGGGTPTNISGLSQVASTGSFGLNNGGDTVTLADNNGVTITEIVYEGEAGDNQSIGRNPDFTGPFVQHSTIFGNGGALFSPGLENDDTSLSIDQVETSKFSIYPNPSNGSSVTISSTGNAAISVQVYDILGKQVKNEILVNNTLSVSNLKSGVYIVKITQNEASTTKKLVIK